MPPANMAVGIKTTTIKLRIASFLIIIKFRFRVSKKEVAIYTNV
jgi:hypothetical protein